MVSVVLKKIILILFRNIGIKIFVSVILNNIVVPKFSKDISEIVPISVITSVSLKLHRLSVIPE